MTGKPPLWVIVKGGRGGVALRFWTGSRWSYAAQLALASVTVDGVRVLFEQRLRERDVTFQDARLSRSVRPWGSK